MDNFMDRIAHKFNAQEMIKANAAAEAAENKRLREQAASYQEYLKEMRRLNLMNVEMGDKLNQMLDTMKTRLDEAHEAKQEEADCTDLAGTLETVKEQLADHVHKENVKVYRNVQAVVVEECAKQTESYKEELQLVKGQLAAVQKQVKIVLVTGILGSLACLGALAALLVRLYGMF